MINIGVGLVLKTTCGKVTCFGVIKSPQQSIFYSLEKTKNGDYYDWGKYLTDIFSILNTHPVGFYICNAVIKLDYPNN